MRQLLKLWWLFALAAVVIIVVLGGYGWMLTY